MDWLKRHVITLIGIFLTALYMYVQLLVWKKHGDDFVLTAVSIIVTAILWLVLVVSIVKQIEKASEVDVLPQRPAEPNQAPSAIAPGIPTLSSLLGIDAAPAFNVTAFLAQAYYSPLTVEAEHNIKSIAQQSYPADKESFYAKFIGVGLVAYQHDVTWLTIYKSQILFLQELSPKIFLPVSSAKAFYDGGKLSNSSTYSHYSLDEWLQFMVD